VRNDEVESMHQNLESLKQKWQSAIKKETKERESGDDIVMQKISALLGEYFKIVNDE